MKALTQQKLLVLLMTGYFILVTVAPAFAEGAEAEDAINSLTRWFYFYIGLPLLLLGMVFLGLKIYFTQATIESIWESMKVQIIGAAIFLAAPAFFLALRELARRFFSV